MHTFTFMRAAAKAVRQAFPYCNAVLVAASICWGQASPSTTQTEVAGFAGAINLRVDGEGITKPIFGGRAGVSTDRLVVFGELGYTRLVNFALSGTASDSLKSSLYDMAGGVNINLRSGRSRAVPYVVGVAGVAIVTISGTTTVGRNVVSVSANESNFSAGGGAGLRFFAGKNWGIQPEFRFARYFASDGGISTFRVTAGVFYRFGK